MRTDWSGTDHRRVEYDADEGLGNKQLVFAEVPEWIGIGWCCHQLRLEMRNIDEEARDKFSRHLQ